MRRRFHREHPRLSCALDHESTGVVLSISAGGDPERFSEVIAVVRDAPPIEGLRVRAFRRRSDLDAKVRLSDAAETDAPCLSADDIACSVKPWGTGIALILWIDPACTREPSMRSVVAPSTRSPRSFDEFTSLVLERAAKVILHNAIGEWDAVMTVQALKILPMQSDLRNMPGAFPFRELPSFLDARTRKTLVNRIGVPDVAHFDPSRASN